MAANITAVVSADVGGFRRSIELARESLQRFSAAENNAGAELRRTNGITEELVKAYQRVLRLMDKATSGTMSTTLAEKALTKLITELRALWANLSETARQGDFGRMLSESISNAETHVKNLRDLIKQLSRDELKAVSSAKGFREAFSLSNIAGAAGFGAVAGGAATLVSSAISATISLVKHAIDVNKEFEVSLSKLLAITGLSATLLSNLTELAKLLGATTQYTATLMAELQIELAKLGFNNTEIFNMTPQVQAMATAMGVLLSDAASLAGSTLRAFGLDSKETLRVVDVLAKSCNLSAIDFEYLHTAMKYAAPIAKSMGMSIEELTSWLGVFANSGIDASTAGSGLRDIIGDLALKFGTTDPTKLINKLKELKASGVDVSKAITTTGKTSASTFLTWLDGIESGEKFTELLRNCKGAAEEMSRVMSDNLDGDLKLLGSSWDGLMLQFSSGLGLIRDLVQALTRFVDKISVVVKKVKDGVEELNSESILFRGILLTSVAVAKTLFDLLVAIIKDAFYAVEGIFKALGKILEGDFTGAVDAIKDWASKTRLTNRLFASNVADNWKNAYDKVINKQEEVLAESLRTEAALAKTNPTAGSTTTDGNAGGSGGSSTEDTRKPLDLRISPIRTEALIKREISELQRKIEKTPAGALRLLLIALKEDLEKELKDFTGRTEALIKREISELQREIENTPAGALRLLLIALKEDLEKELKDFGKTPIQLQMENTLVSVGSTPEPKVNKWKGYGSSMKEGYNGLLDMIGASEEFDSIWNGIFKNWDEMDFGQKFFTLSDAIFGSIDAINSFIEGIGHMKDMINTFKAVSSAASKQKIAENAAETASEHTKTAAEVGSAAGGIFSAHSSIPWVGVAIAIGLIGAMMAVMSQFHKGGIVGKFAGGGMISGASGLGDMNLARVNSGEMILNGSQQSHLFNLLNSSGGYSTPGTGGEVHFRIQGEDLVGVLLTHNRRNNKVL